MHTLDTILKRHAMRQLGRIRRIFRRGTHSDEDVHDMRVALRRFRAILRIARSAGCADDAKAIKKRARTAAMRLGAVRDLDVIAERIQRDASKGRIDKRDALHWLTELREARQIAHAAALTYLQRPKLERTWSKALDWASSPALRAMRNAHLEDLLRNEAQDVMQHLKPTCEAELHALRIAAKHLRYLIEFFGASVADSEEWIAQLVKVQDALGNHRDAFATADLARSRGLHEYAEWLERRASKGVDKAQATARLVSQQVLEAT